MVTTDAVRPSKRDSIVELLTTIDTTVDIEDSLTPVQEFYNNTSVFVTGGTGFLGQVLLEKLLRSCPVSKIYVLMRKKKGKDMDTRLKEMFEDPIFQRIRNQFPERWEKIVPVEGNCAMPDLGLGDQDKKLLTDEIEIIFHVAATVRFDEKLKIAVPTNVRAIRDLLRLARQMPRLKSFMHVSTAFSNCIQQPVVEDIYPPAANYEGMIEATEMLDDRVLDAITPSLVGKYPNTYAYTKQIAEGVIKQEGQGLPIGVQRPSIVISTYKEPIRGWVNNIFGPSGIVIACGMGILRVMHCNPDFKSNVVPVDMCVNSLIASAWDVAENFREAREEQSPPKILVYNFESSIDNPISWQHFTQEILKYGRNYIPEQSIWYYCFYQQRSYFIFRLMAFFLHTIPAFLIDAVLFCMGKPTMMTKIYEKANKFITVLAFFTTNEFVFRSENVQRVVRTMTERDRRIFFSDLKQLNWKEYFMCYGLGERTYLMKESLDTLPASRRKNVRLYWAHQSVKVVLSLLLIWIVWALVSFVFKYVF